VGGVGSSQLSRRQFLRAAAGAGALAAVPSVLQPFFDAVRADVLPASTFYFLDNGPVPQPRSATCAAVAARIVPSDGGPGADEAHTVVFVDRFLAAFDLPSSVADNPAIYLAGDDSGRNPFPDFVSGGPSSNFPADDFLTVSGTTAVAHFLPLSPLQQLSWRAQLYGTAALNDAPTWASTWAEQARERVGPGLRQLYADGLPAFDEYSQGLFGVTFDQASPQQQDFMLAAIGNPVLGGIPLPFASPPAPPPAASALFPVLVLHTFQACYGLPEYRWLNQANDPANIGVVTGLVPGTPHWRDIRWDGDTQPLGNSVYDSDLVDPNQPNEGYGVAFAGPGGRVYKLTGGYREFRPVSSLADEGETLTPADAETIATAIRNATGTQ
jgi:hypothetical protein